MLIKVASVSVTLKKERAVAVVLPSKRTNNGGSGFNSSIAVVEGPAFMGDNVSLVLENRVELTLPETVSGPIEVG